MTARILVAGDHVIYTEALAGLLNQIPGFRVAGVVSSHRELVPAIRKASAGSLVLGGVTPNVVETVHEVRNHVPHCGITLITEQPGQVALVKVQESEMVSVISRGARLNQLIGTIRSMQARQQDLRGSERPKDASRPAAGLLSQRERDVLRSTATGASVKEIAREFYLAPGTVRNLTSSAIKKLQARNRYDAARIAEELGSI
ncbi:MULTISPECIES: response regulator transcription factor [unclassified Streptomyces]|uniref:response regulator transcription factor n=1 Tax=unclassified Streptomyces TaxID=2593676 RepID=UPI0023618D0C|nr:response regulator transcription factor [Streptomyces sp. MMBL 11-1]